MHHSLIIQDDVSAVPIIVFMKLSIIFIAMTDHEAFWRTWRHASPYVISLSSWRQERIDLVRSRASHRHWVLQVVIDGSSRFRFPHVCLEAQACSGVLTRPEEGLIQEMHHGPQGLWLIVVDFEMHIRPGWRDPLQLLASPALVQFDDPAWLRSWADEAQARCGQSTGNLVQQRPLVDLLLTRFVTIGMSDGQLSMKGATAPRWLGDVLVRMGSPHMLSDPELDLAMIARLAGVQPNHLCRSFRQFYGISPMRWVRRERIGMACRRLGHDDSGSIAVIARACGYRSSELFCRHFRGLMGCSPRQWRKATEGATDSSGMPA